MDKCVITGCDANTEWQLPWFIENYKKHNTTPLLIADFGMTDEMVTYARLNCTYLMDATRIGVKGWMKKPHTMVSTPAKKTIWVDTDCHIRGDISGIFDYTRPNKLTMAVDRPWTKRRGERWHNSGVVAFEGVPVVLKEWARYCHEKAGEINGDQEVLQWMMGGDELRRMTFIEDLPHKYNTLRIDLDDGFNDNGVLIMHWTGQKGNDVIRKMMK